MVGFADNVHNEFLVEKRPFFLWGPQDSGGRPCTVVVATSCWWKNFRGTQGHDVAATKQLCSNRIEQWLILLVSVLWTFLGGQSLGSIESFFRGQMTPIIGGTKRFFTTSIVPKWPLLTCIQQTLRNFCGCNWQTSLGFIFSYHYKNLQKSRIFFKSK